MVKCKRCGCKIELIKNTPKLYCDDCRIERNSEYKKLYDKNGGDKEYRRIIVSYIGRSFKDDETVHHIDGDNKNNNLKNLYIFKNRKEHWLYHHSILSKWAIKFPFMTTDEAENTYPYLKSNLKEIKDEL